MSEKLELVTDFGSLRAGDLVVVKCYRCRLKNRGMLMGIEDASADSDDPTPGWTMMPELGAHDHEKPDPEEWEMLVGPGTVAAGIVYRVIIPDADKALTVDRVRPLERVR